MKRDIIVSKNLSRQIDNLLLKEPQTKDECFGEDDFFAKSAVFPDGSFVDIMLCGVQYEEGESNLPWTQAVLFNNLGDQLTYTEPETEFFGEWILEHDNTEYVVNVLRG